MSTGWDTAWLWAAVVGMGAYHGLNPAMGWPLAVASGLSERRDTAVLGTVGLLGAGHLLAMALVLLPFTLLAWLAQWGDSLRLAAGATVAAFGLLRLFARRHPGWLVRVPPARVMLWSFLMALAHGAALMLLPVLLGLCRAVGPAPAGTTGQPGHQAVEALMTANLQAAIGVTLLHSAAMVGAGLAAAWLVYRYIGLKALRAAWFNLDRVWALSLIASGGAAMLLALQGTAH